MITRHWVHSGACDERLIDVYMLSAYLRYLLKPVEPIQQLYHEVAGHPLQKDKLLSQIFLGATAARKANRDKKAKSLVNAFAAHFERVNGRDAREIVDLLLHVYGTAGDVRDRAFADATIRNEAFWTGIIHCLKRAYESREPDSDGKTQSKVYMPPLVTILCQPWSPFTSVENRAKLFDVFIRAKFFDVLEDVIEELGTMPTRLDLFGV